MSDVILRVFFAMVFALAFGFIFIHYFILLARKMGLGQSVRLDGPKRHLPKEGIPTAAGLVIWSGVILSACLWANLKDTFVQIALWVILSFGCIGFVDDVLKIKRGEGRGFSIRNKLLLQGVVALATAGWIYIATNGSSNLHIPVAGCDLDLGLFYILFAAAVIFFFSNAVNLTDGLDGMVTVPSLCTMLVLLLFCYIGQVGELMVVLGAASGSLIAFLWYNCYPARVFMGDTGSLPLGALLGMSALAVKQEILFFIAGGLFILEALSVFLQIFSFRLREKRIFKMAPLHHHYELKGWPEPMVVVKFWIISIILAAVSVGVLRIG
ncbi:MAG: phospho-N-acetylmuramoyl-pentapeptide-transferase [Deltaproteobacteria bacterium]|nr:phospho-N-acetylmuramoyl-pentapeptide-transferase [Deltaproteobacteria bacterium]